MKKLLKFICEFLSYFISMCLLALALCIGFNLSCGLITDVKELNKKEYLISDQFAQLEVFDRVAVYVMIKTL